MDQLASNANAVIQGWITYFGKFYSSHLETKVLLYINDRLVIWVTRKYKRFKKSKRRARKWLQAIYKCEPGLWAHWRDY